MFKDAKGITMCGFPTGVLSAFLKAPNPTELLGSAAMAVGPLQPPRTGPDRKTRTQRCHTPRQVGFCLPFFLNHFEAGLINAKDALGI